MTAEEICIQALARCMEFGNTWPSTRSLMYARIAQRTRQLFAKMTVAFPAIAVESETVPIVDGVVDLTSLDYDIASLVEVTIAADGDYAEGQRVTIVPPNDLDAGLPPRMMAVMGELRVVADDLQDGESVVVTYTRLAEDITDGGDTPEIPEAFHSLLVVDLAKALVQKAISVPAQTRGEIIQLLAAEEQEQLNDFAKYLNAYAPTASRFADNTSAGDAA